MVGDAGFRFVRGGFEIVVGLDGQLSAVKGSVLALDTIPQQPAFKLPPCRSTAPPKPEWIAAQFPSRRSRRRSARFPDEYLELWNSAAKSPVAASRPSITRPLEASTGAAACLPSSRKALKVAP